MQTAKDYRYYDYQKEHISRERSGKEDKGFSLSAKERKRALAATLIAALICILVVASSVYTQKLQYEVNSLIQANSEIEKDITETSFTLEKKCNIVTLEKKAKNKLGMTYPKASQIVYVDDIKAPADFEATVKQQADN